PGHRWALVVAGGMVVNGVVDRFAHPSPIRGRATASGRPGRGDTSPPSGTHRCTGRPTCWGSRRQASPLYACLSSLPSLLRPQRRVRPPVTRVDDVLGL